MRLIALPFVIALPLGLVFFLILFLLADSIEAAVQLTPILGDPTRGPVTLLIINSGLLGHVSKVVWQKHTGITGIGLFSLGLVSTVAAIGSGFGMAAYLLGTFPTSWLEVVAYCFVTACGILLVEIWFEN